MKKILLIIILSMLFPISAFSKKDENIIDVKEKHKAVFGKTRLFKVTESLYDKRPQLVDAMNIYTMTLKVKKAQGEGVLTFVRQPQEGATGDKNKPEYRTLVLKVFKPGRQEIEKEYQIPLHLKSDQIMAVYHGQKLIISWHGDGGFGAKGFHFFSYNEKLTK